MEIIKPGNFGKVVAADSLRYLFDYQNEQLLHLGKKVDFLFIGDSITHHWDLNAYIDTDKFIVNRGIGGDTSEYVLKRFDAYCIQLKPKTAIMMIGTNDIFRCDGDIWWRQPGESEDVVFEDYKSNIKEIIKKCDDNNIELILCLVVPSLIAPPFDREMRWRMTKRFNEFLKSTGKKIVDYSPALSDDGITMNYDISPDGIHPGAEGYRRMVEELKKVVSFD